MLIEDSLGTAAMSFGLPILLYAFAFGCNDVTGCPAPSLLNPKTLDLETLKREVGWPEDGILGLCSWRVMGWNLVCYLFSAVLHRILPGVEVEGTELANGGRLKYKFNGEWSARLETSPQTTLANYRSPLLNYLYPRHLPRRHHRPGRRFPGLDLHHR